MPRTPENPQVLELREEIARLDHSLVLLVAARQEAARRLFAVKESSGLPLFDLEQESHVIARARRWAREVGAAPDEVQSVFDRLITVARRGAARRRHAQEDSGVVTVLLAIPPALPRVRIERSLPSPIVAGLPRALDDDEDHELGLSDDHHIHSNGRRPKPASHPHLPA